MWRIELFKLFLHIKTYFCITFLFILNILDNVVLQLNAILFLKVKNPYLASYGVSEADVAITQVSEGV